MVCTKGLVGYRVLNNVEMYELTKEEQRIVQDQIVSLKVAQSKVEHAKSVLNGMLLLLAKSHGFQGAIS